MIKLTQKNEKFVWTKQCEESFKELKRRLISASMLALPTSKEKLMIMWHRSLARVLQTSYDVFAPNNKDVTIALRFSLFCQNQYGTERKAPVSGCSMNFGKSFSTNSEYH